MIADGDRRRGSSSARRTSPFESASRPSTPESTSVPSMFRVRTGSSNRGHEIVVLGDADHVVAGEQRLGRRAPSTPASDPGVESRAPIRYCVSSCEELGVVAVAHVDQPAVGVRLEVDRRAADRSGSAPVWKSRVDDRADEHDLGQRRGGAASGIGIGQRRPDASAVACRAGGLRRRARSGAAAPTLPRRAQERRQQRDEDEVSPALAALGQRYATTPPANGHSARARSPGS